MVLSRRERYVGMGVALVMGIFVLDRFFVSPLLAQKDDLDGKVATAQQKLDRAQRMRTTSRQMTPRWQSMLKGGLTRDASEAEGQIYRKIREWAEEARLTLSSVKTERTEREKDFVKITFRATGTGGMAQITAFLWQIQNANVPVRVADLTINTSKEGTDELTAHMGIATTYLAPVKTDKPAAAGAPGESLP